MVSSPTSGCTSSRSSIAQVRLQKCALLLIPCLLGTNLQVTYKPTILMEDYEAASFQANK